MTWCKLQIHAVGGPSDLMWVYTQVIEQEGLHTGTVKILNSHGTATYLRFIKSTSFYFCTYSPLFIGYFQERLLLKWTDICQNILHFKSYHQQKFTNCLGFWQISKRKLLSLTSAYSFIKKFICGFRFGILFTPKWEFLLFKKSIIQIWIFNCNKCILWDCG